MRPVETNIVPIQYKTWVIGGTVLLGNGCDSYNGSRPRINFNATLPGQYTLIRGQSFFSNTFGTLSPGTDLLPYFRVVLSASDLAVQSFTLDSTGREAILVVRPKST
jgi:hypothetical protein